MSKSQFLAMEAMKRQKLVSKFVYTTHQPVLDYFKNTLHRHITEFGSGHSSTWIVDVSYEDNQQWFEQTKHYNNVHFSPNLLDVELSTVDTIFIDNGNWSDRIHLMKKYKDQADYIILHDSDWFGKNGHIFTDHFQYVKTITPRVKYSEEGPPTTICSNKHNLDDIEIDQLCKGKMFMPDNTYGLGNILRNWYTLNNQEPTIMLTPHKLEIVSVQEKIIFDHYDLIENDRYEQCPQHLKCYNNSNDTLDQFIKTLKCSDHIKKDQVVVHIRYGDKYSYFNEPYIRIPETWENDKKIKDMLDQIQSNEQSEILVISDHPKYEGKHDIRQIRQKEVDDFLTLRYAKKVYTFKGTDGSCSTFPLMATINTDVPVYLVDIVKNEVTLNNDKELVFKI